MSEEQQANNSGSKLLSGIVVLGCICLASGAGVAVLYASMKGKIEAKQKAVFRDTLAVVLGAGGNNVPVGSYAEGTEDNEKVYENAQADPPLYAAIGAAKGYGGPVTVLVAVRSDAAGRPLGDDPVIEAMAVVSSSETPGLGENIRAVEQTVSIWAKIAGAGGDESVVLRPKFQEQFSGKRLGALVVEKRPDTAGIEALTGATITSVAATEAVRNAVQTIIEKTAEAYGP